MSDCKCEAVKIYDGQHRCMKCYKEFIVKPPKKPPTWKDEMGVTHHPLPRREIIFDEASNIPDAVWKPRFMISEQGVTYNKAGEATLGTRRSDNLPLGVKPNES